MADTIKIGNLDISAFKVGSADCKVYLGDTLLYPQTPPTPTGYKWLAIYSDSHTESAQCDSSSGTIIREEISKTNLVSVEVGDCVASIGVSAFTNATSIEEVVLPEGLTLIDFSSFKGCTSLTSVTIPSTVTVIGTDSFSGCTGLLNITFLSETPIRVYTNTFYDSTCPIYVPCESVEAYKSASGWSSYASRIEGIPPCSSFKWKATYSDSHTWSAACDASSAITEYDIDTNNLVSFEIGDCVTDIGEYNMWHGGVFALCTSISSCTIGSGVTTIGDLTFYYCSGLTSIDIPSGVTTIGNIAFEGCTSLTSITINAVTPPTLGFDAFKGSTCPIYVPAVSVEDYKAAQGWSTYASRIQAIP